MKRFFTFVILILILSGCSSILEKAREQDKFTLEKKYAIFPFDCTNKQLGIDLAEMVKEHLQMYDYNIVSQQELETLLSECKLTHDEVIKNYALALGKLKGVDGIIVGYISLEKKNAESGKESGTSVGGTSNFINSCDAAVVDVNSGDILSRGKYTAPPNSVFTGKIPIEDIGKRIALLLSPH